jgi:hypothetical protein
VRILFVTDRRANAGSIQAIASYVRAGDRLGYIMALYGHPDPNYPGVRCSTELAGFDYVLFVCEYGIGWMSGLRMAKVFSEVPRERRAVLDADGMYNMIVSVDGYDRNHANEHDRFQWMRRCDAVADKILQPTLTPLDPFITAFPFYGFDPSLCIAPHQAPSKRFDLLHVGHNWWRWREVSTSLLPAIEQIRPHLDGIGFVGLWWDLVPAGAQEQDLEIAFGFDEDRFRRLGIQVRSAVPFTDVVSVMSQARANIMTQRPLFRRLKLLTAKYFELFCADTIPLVMLDPDYAESVYGPAGREIALQGDIPGKLLDVLHHPKKYQEIVHEVRQHLLAHHSYGQRAERLVAALQQSPRRPRSCEEELGHCPGIPSKRGGAPVLSNLRRGTHQGA